MAEVLPLIGLPTTRRCLEIALVTCGTTLFVR
jgi:hypothetical protein